MKNTMKKSAHPEPVFKLITLALVASAALTTLTACVPLVVGGAMVGGTMVAIDRRTSGAQLEDEGIELRAASRIRTSVGDKVHVNITSYNRQVLITGEAPTEQDKQAVGQIVAKVENVGSVVNELAILGNSTITQRSSDVLVTGRIKAALIDSKDLVSNAFKVVTERGTVYLMGRVTAREADRATAIARATSGVQKVVRVFETITEEELTRMMPAPAKPDANRTAPPAN
jgi:osmotically-inducible protein OsmY